jgi:hypothetical protein
MTKGTAAPTSAPTPAQTYKTSDCIQVSPQVINSSAVLQYSGICSQIYQVCRGMIDISVLCIILIHVNHSTLIEILLFVSIHCNTNIHDTSIFSLTTHHLLSYENLRF